VEGGGGGGEEGRKEKERAGEGKEGRRSE